ncbi:MAG TPA: NADH:ubiquinone oxidoreductase [candidate division Zixibacteria bacterium]|nr:NADH:ubiquinone oxidoreductase [candidate division Zixibacteria bacterium]
MKKTILPIGPFHPLLEEPEFFTFHLDGETVIDVDVRIGYNHRGHEKLATGLTWDQVPFLVERICGICSTSHPYAYVLAVEDMLGIEPPPRGKYIRSLIGEMERIHSHLLWLGLAGHFIGYNTVWMWAWRYREEILDACELLSGNRNHYAMCRVGGARRDVSQKALDFTMKALDTNEKSTKMFLGAVADDPVIHKRLKGVGILTKEDAIAYCATGPTSRPSGVRWDIRETDPYDAYGESLEAGAWKVIVTENGDVFDKAVVRVLETLESIYLCRWLIENMPDGDFQVVPGEMHEGEGCGHHEAPRGEVFHYVRSDGSNKPIRHKVRAPTFSNLPTYKASCPGEQIADVALITAAIDPCYCCTERVGVIAGGKHSSLTQDDLVKLSVEKTMEIEKRMGVKSVLNKFK